MSRRSYDGKETSGRENGAGGAVFYTGSAEDMTDQQCHQFAHSLRNKMEELRLNTRVCHEYREFCLIFTETWLQEDFQDALVQVQGFTNVRMDITGYILFCVDNVIPKILPYFNLFCQKVIDGNMEAIDEILECAGNR